MYNEMVDFGGGTVGVALGREEDFVGVFLLWENILHRQKNALRRKIILAI
jgi:hypothetical protein